MISSSDSRTRAALMAGAAILACVLFWPAFAFAWSMWGIDPNYGHAYFIPPAACYLLWRKRAAIQSHVPNPSTTGLALALPAIALHATANYVTGPPLFWYDERCI